VRVTFFKAWKQVAFQISGITKHQYYYQKKQTRSSLFYQYILHDSYGQKRKFPMILLPKKWSKFTRIQTPIMAIKKMKTALQIKGYNINHKKVYRLMKKLNCYRKNIKTF
jgi:hypothetical protein